MLQDVLIRRRVEQRRLPALLHDVVKPLHSPSLCFLPRFASLFDGCGTARCGPAAARRRRLGSGPVPTPSNICRNQRKRGGVGGKGLINKKKDVSGITQQFGGDFFLLCFFFLKIKCNTLAGPEASSGVFKCSISQSRGCTSRQRRGRRDQSL